MIKMLFVGLNILFALSCTKNDGVAPTDPILSPDFSKLTPSCFIANATNPILTRDSLLAGSD